MDLQKMFQSITEKLESSASVKNVYGEPIVAQGKTVVPVAKIGYGFGGGGGKRNMAESEQSHEGADGGGGGGGVGAIPVGVIEITAEGTRFVPIGIEKKLLSALLAGCALGFLFAKRSGRH